MLFPKARAAARGLVLSTFALALAACGGASSDEPAPSPGAGAGENPAPGNENATGALAEMALGSSDAEITVIEFASVTCPHCATFHETVFPEIKENYIDTGKVRFVFREFPTAPANLSVAGSMLARCAADKGGSDAYFLVLGALFKTQRTWIYGDAPREELIKIASQAGMDEAAFDACVNRKELVDLINENVKAGVDQYDVNSTPSFVVDGQLRHFSTYEDFAKALDEALEKTDE